MKKMILCIVVLLIGITAILPAATDQFSFDLNAGVWFYPGFGTRISWMRFWTNDRIGVIGDIRYYNNGFFGVESCGGNEMRENIRRAHNFGFAAGIVFNNMGFSGVIRTSQYIKLGCTFSTWNWDLWNRLEVFPVINIGAKISAFFTEKTALSLGLGFDNIFPYVSLGMIFTR